MRLLVFGGRNFGYKQEQIEPFTGRFRWVPVWSAIEWMWDQLDARYQKWVADDTIHPDGYCDEFVIVSGSCPTGADFLAEAWAASRGVPVERYPADWSLGKSAGPARNEEMAATRPDLAMAFPGGRGTDDMFSCCLKHDIDTVDFRGFIF